MHRTLTVPELLRYIFVDSDKADLAALARTCRTFKEPALDLLWGKLDNLSPLMRCIPDACHVSHARCYSFGRSLNEAEQRTLRGYAYRVRVIHTREKPIYLSESAIETIFNLEPLTDPLFPNLQSLYWEFSTDLSAHHVAVLSLTSLVLPNPDTPINTEFFNVLVDRCPHMREFVVLYSSSHPEDETISRQVCRWSNLHQVDCQFVALSMDAITHLSSAPHLKQLSFTVEEDAIQDVSRLGSKLVFSELADLGVTSGFLDTITLLLSHVRIPAAKSLAVDFLHYVSKRAANAFWDAAREACPLVASIYLELRKRGRRLSPDGDTHPQLTLEYIYPCTAFSELRVLHVNFSLRVGLTDADLLQLASPRMEEIIINDTFGWKAGVGGITLTGLVQLLRQCPFLNELCVAIDTSTFTPISEGLDVSFPPREGLSFNFVDSWIRPEFVSGVVSASLKLDPSMYTVWVDIYQDDKGCLLSLWEKVDEELGGTSRESLASEMYIRTYA